MCSTWKSVLAWVSCRLDFEQVSEAKGHQRYMFIGGLTMGLIP